MKRYFDHVLDTFGYSCKDDLVKSMIHIDMLKITIPMSVVSVFVEKYFGLDFVSIIAFTSVLVLELWTGITASKCNKESITSPKLSRFFLKVFAWLNVLFILNTFKWHYEVIRPLVASAYDWLHTMVVIYVTFEYLISILENIAVLSGKSNKALTKAIHRMISHLLNYKYGK